MNKEKFIVRLSDASKLTDFIVEINIDRKYLIKN